MTAPDEAFNAYNAFLKENVGADAADDILKEMDAKTAAVVHSNLAVAYEVYRLHKTLRAFAEATFPLMKPE